MLYEWMNKHLQEPFFIVEMAKTEINVAEGAEANLGAVKVMAVFGSVYMAICAYWFDKYIIG